MRSTLNIKHGSAADLAKSLRSLAAKIDADALVPGADIVIGNVRVQVAVPQVSDIRAFARENGYPVGTRGRYSKSLIEAFEAHKREVAAEQKAARAAARAAKREAVAV